MLSLLPFFKPLKETGSFIFRDEWFFRSGNLQTDKKFARKIMFHLHNCCKIDQILSVDPKELNSWNQLSHLIQRLWYWIFFLVESYQYRTSELTIKTGNSVDRNIIVFIIGKHQKIGLASASSQIFQYIFQFPVRWRRVLEEIFEIVDLFKSRLNIFFLKRF